MKTITILLLTACLVSQSQANCQSALNRLTREVEKGLELAGYPEYTITEEGDLVYAKGKKVVRVKLNWSGIPSKVKSCIIRNNGAIGRCNKGCR